MYLNGVKQEILKTDVNGKATSSKSYPLGTKLTVKETKAPPGYKLNSTTYTITISSGTNLIRASDEPLFDPPFAITKIDKETTVAQGNSSFKGAIFKWEYYDNYTWSGTPKRTWYFETNKNGRADYLASCLALDYTSDALYYDNNGVTSIPLGSVKITEIKNPLGYTVLSQSLKCTITVDASGNVKTTWDSASAEIIQNAKDGNFDVPEPQDKDTLGSVKVKKVSEDTNEPLEGAVFEIINNSTNPVKVGDHAVAAKGEVCYEITTGADGIASTGNILPLGLYIIREKTAPSGYVLNETWEKSVPISSAMKDFDFTNSSNVCKDAPARGGLRIEKLVEDSSGNTDCIPELEGIRFAVINDNDYAVTVDGISCNKGETVLTLTIAVEDGVAFAETSATALPFGVYIVHELPESEEVDYANDLCYLAEDQTVTITEHGTLVQLVFVDPLRTGEISVLKVNENGVPMPGVKFRLLYRKVETNSWTAIDADMTTAPVDSDGCLVTDGEGAVAYTELDPRWEYRLVEVETANGYQLLQGDAYCGKLPGDGLTVTLRVTNYPVFRIPETGAEGFAPISIAVAAMLLFGTALIYIPKQKRGEV